MNTLRILFFVLFSIMFKKNQIFLHCSNNEILFSSRVADVNILFMSHTNYHKHYNYPKGSVCTELKQLLQVISEKVEPNPGRRTPKYRCGDCGNVVTINSTICEYLQCLVPPWMCWHEFTNIWRLCQKFWNGVRICTRWHAEQIKLNLW